MGEDQEQIKYTSEFVEEYLGQKPKAVTPSDPSLTVNSDKKSVKLHEIRLFGSDRPNFHSGMPSRFSLVSPKLTKFYTVS